MKKILNDSNGPICLTALLDELTGREMTVRGEPVQVVTWHWSIGGLLNFCGRPETHHLNVRLTVRGDELLPRRVREKRDTDWRLAWTADQLGIARDRLLHVGRAPHLDSAVHRAVKALGSCTLGEIEGRTFYIFREHGRCEIQWVDEERQAGRFVVIKSEMPPLPPNPPPNPSRRG